jgi:two-component system OmpR family sensor kinase
MSAAPGRLPSLQRELARSLTLISGVWLLAVFLAMAFGVRHEVDELLDDAIQASANVLYGTLVQNQAELLHAGTVPQPAGEQQESLAWQLVDRQQRVLMRSHNAPVAPLLAAFQSGFSDTAAHWRVYAMAMPTEGQALYVAQRGMHRMESRYEAIAVVGISSVLVGLACAYWLRRRVAHALRPVLELSRQIMHYDPTRAQTTLLPASRREFVEVREAILDLGERLARRIDNEQAFAAHAAHALRTPLAGMDAQLAMALKEVPESARARVEGARQAVRRLKRVVGSLLTLFRSNAELDLQDVRLQELVGHLPVDGLQVHVEQQGELRADPNLLAAALANLLDNALRHGARNCWIVCQPGLPGQRITVRDDGPGADAERLQALRGQLRDSGTERLPGLGLKLASVVARAHAGHLELDSGGPDGGGFCVTMALWAKSDETPGAAGP